MPLLRDRLLAGRRIVVAGSPLGVLSEALGELEAELEPLALAELPAEEERAGEWAREHGRLDALVYCAAGAFGAGGQEGLGAVLADAWLAVREVALGSLIATQDPGKLVLIAPRPGDGPLAGAARAGLENLARTLSVEWARYGLTAVMIAPGERASEPQVAQLVAFLVSEAGGYFSGCRLEVGAVAAR